MHLLSLSVSLSDQVREEALTLDCLLSTASCLLHHSSNYRFHLVAQRSIHIGTLSNLSSGNCYVHHSLSRSDSRWLWPDTVPSPPGPTGFATQLTWLPSHDRRRQLVSVPCQPYTADASRLPPQAINPVQPRLPNAPRTNLTTPQNLVQESK